MSMALGDRNSLRSFRSLIAFARSARVFMKDLKALENKTTRVAIDM